MDPSDRPMTGPPQGNRFFHKLGIYLTGVAIGLVFLGWVQYRKSLSAKKQQQFQQVDPTSAPAAEAPAAAPTESP